jgi:hypothetical protein
MSSAASTQVDLVPTLGALLIGVVLGAVYVFVFVCVTGDDDETDPPLARRSGSLELPFCKPSFMCVRRNDDAILPTFSSEPSSILKQYRTYPEDTLFLKSLVSRITP